MMTCTSLTVLEDLKVIITEGLSKICPPGNVPREYEALQLCLALGEPGTRGHYPLIGFFTLSGPHKRLRDTILIHPDFLQEAMPLVNPWHEPPF